MTQPPTDAARADGTPCRYCGGAKRFQIVSPVSDHAWAGCFCTRQQPEAGREGERLRMFLEILSKMGGQSDASEYAWSWTNAFCDDGEPDTFNLAIDRGFTRSTHESDTDHSMVYLTDAGRAYLATRLAVPTGVGREEVGRVLDTFAPGMLHSEKIDAVLALLSHAEAGGVEVPSGALPEMIGRVHLGERASNGETLCSYSHTVPAGHPLYWPERMGEYPDDMDPLCLAHAIEQAENDAGWCSTCSAREFEDDDLTASPAAVAGGDA